MMQVWQLGNVQSNAVLHTAQVMPAVQCCLPIILVVKRLQVVYCNAAGMQLGHMLSYIMLNP